MKVGWLKSVFSESCNSLVWKILLSCYPVYANTQVFGGEYANLLMHHCKNHFWAVAKHYKVVL